MVNGRHAAMAVVVLLGTSCYPGQGNDEDKSVDLKISKDEQTSIELVNKSREKNKLPPLKPNAKLFAAARSHSLNMAKQGKMEHELDGKKPSDRVKAVGYEYRKVGENIAAGEGWSLEAVHQAWLDSRLHRENMLDPSYTEIGVGIAKSAKGELYYTHVFGTRRPD